ncbi:MAG TPA: tRNA guanosine(34) transglycosylase Tgt [Thermomicrobiales bacterium]|jgi:tRNA-guanine transglycosylase
MPTDSPESNLAATTRQDGTPLSFAIEARIPNAGGRAGTLTLPHGTVETPAFMVVGTQATIKSLTPEEVRGLGTQMILGNAYHLYLRPGAALVAEFGGLHKFMGWDGPILTDSGGFQVFSLGFALEHGVGKIAKIFPGEGSQAPKRAQRPKLTRIDDDGVTFTSHLDGSTHRFTPEVSIGIQQQLGADVIVAFDECTSPLHDHPYTARALDRTHRWADRCLAAWTRRDDQALFGIVQGGAYRDLRLQSAEFFASRPFPGYCIGGSLGKDKDDMRAILDWTLPILPEERPRHLLGIGEPEDFFSAIERGIDLFDCVAPTRLARHGALYTADGRLQIKAARYTHDQGPIEEGCGCYTCQRFSRGYLRHLFHAGETLALRLASLHNLYFIVNLVRAIRASILDGTFATFRDSYLSRYTAKRGSMAGNTLSA